MRELHLVRHGRPKIEPELSAELWALDARAADPIARLRAADVLPRPANWYSSAEPKAVATASLLTDTPVTLVEELGEMRRPAGWVDDADEWSQLVRRSLEEPHGPAGDGWETAEQTQQRVVAAVEAIAKASAGPVVLVGHGTAWTLLVAALTAQPPDIAGWQSLLMPDHCDRGPTLADGQSLGGVARERLS